MLSQPLLPWGAIFRALPQVHPHRARGLACICRRTGAQSSNPRHLEEVLTLHRLRRLVCERKGLLTSPANPSPACLGRGQNRPPHGRPEPRLAPEGAEVPPGTKLGTRLALCLPAPGRPLAPSQPWAKEVPFTCRQTRVRAHRGMLGGALRPVPTPNLPPLWTPASGPTGRCGPSVPVRSRRPL